MDVAKKRNIEDMRFYVCNNGKIVIFDAININHFPKIEKKLTNAFPGTDFTAGSGVIFASVDTTAKVTIDNIDEMSLNGVALINQTNKGKLISILDTNSEETTSLLLGVITPVFETVGLWIKIEREKWIPNYLKLLISHGFEKPFLMKDVVYLKFKKRTSLNVTMCHIEALINSVLSNNMLNFKARFPTHVTRLLRGYLSKPYEVSGKLAIKDYDEKGRALLTFDKFTLNEGSETNFTAQLVTNAILSFHTHPDVCYKEFGCFTGWPSGGDMRVIPRQYLLNDDILAHFVVCSEGMWVIHLTYPFQKALFALKKNPDTTICKTLMLDAIQIRFEKAEAARNIDIVDAMERHNSIPDFLEMANTYSLSALSRDVPMVAEACDFKDNNSLLFNLKLLKWDIFNDKDYVDLSFDYLPDPEGGLPRFIPVDSTVQCAV